MSQQYHLPLPHHEAMTADDFMITASNREAVSWVLEREPASWPAHCLILYGPQGCGKTHLLTVWREKHNARRIKAGEDVVAEILESGECPSPLEGEEAKTLACVSKSLVFAGEGSTLHPLPLTPPSRGEGKIKALILDNADKIAGNAGHEEWLQHLYNATKAAGMPLLLAASKAPALWGLGLKDIESRLKSCPAIEMKEPDDELMRGMLLKQFGDRQLLVEMDVIDYLVPRLERTGTAVRQTVELLDKKALAKSRKITVPFVREEIG
ncbi:MAG: DnaA/Hda family protein [Alphaproteobacteria bacterium]|nr:DnaA/Hda family protein [Alphaproteobacteria bacterium]